MNSRERRRQAGAARRISGFEGRLIPSAWVILLLGAIAVYGCARADTSGIEVRNARAMATPPGARIGGAFMEIVSVRDDTLTGVSSPIAERVELHESRQENGIARMRPLSRLELQAQRPYVLRPGGAHLMLIGLREPLRAGARFPMHLQFAQAGEVVVQVEVRAPDSMEHHRMHEHHGTGHGTQDTHDAHGADSAPAHDAHQAGDARAPDRSGRAAPAARATALAEQRLQPRSEQIAEHAR